VISSPPYVSRLSREPGNLVSQQYRLPRSVTEIALLLFYNSTSARSNLKQIPLGTIGAPPMFRGPMVGEQLWRHALDNIGGGGGGGPRFSLRTQSDCQFHAFLTCGSRVVRRVFLFWPRHSSEIRPNIHFKVNKV
jgi:hypothetical protein